MDHGILEINLNGTPKFKKTVYLLYGDMYLRKSERRLLNYIMNEL
jgi:hypothetical protein